jgi:glycosyltransferase involved in cell wall biosynthesis
MVIRAYARLRGDWPLVIVGGNSYDRPYVHRLESLADERVIFTGPVYGSGYWRLLKNAGLYIFACEVGGVHPALIEAMAAGRAILYLDTPENRETARDCAVPFPAGDHNLAAQMELLLADAGLRRNLGEKARMRAEALFGWEEITNRYESLLAELLERTRVAAPAR